MYFVCFSLYCFFFFKQKTAYEMRISDWSSDVCSSDLADVQRLPRRLDQRGLAQGLVDLGQLVRDVGDVDPLLILVAGLLREAEQIGRASCRERVCQYV